MALIAAPPAGGAPGAGANGGAGAIGGFSSPTPQNNILPGSNLAAQVASGIMYFSLIFVFIGLVLSAGLWAVGAFSNNYTQSVNGKKGFLICAASALVIGGAFLLISWAFSTGSGLSATAIQNG